MPTALLSVYDKTGIVELAAGLHEAGWRIVSSGGTAREVAAAGVPVTDLAELTGLPAILDHRVVTLHPKVHGGLLADPTKPEHQADMAAHGIEPIDLVVVNLYPFDSDPSIELIDIGGPAMVRAAAKNHGLLDDKGIERAAWWATRWADRSRWRLPWGSRRASSGWCWRRLRRDRVAWCWGWPSSTWRVAAPEP